MSSSFWGLIPPQRVTYMDDQVRLLVARDYQKRDTTMRNESHRGGIGRAFVITAAFLTAAIAPGAGAAKAKDAGAIELVVTRVAGPSFRNLLTEKGLDGWMSANGKAPGKGWVLNDGVLSREGKGGNIWTKERFGDFILDLEFKTTGNSGVLFRCDNPRSYVQTGMEMQVINHMKPEDKHSAGAMYDLRAPSKDVLKPNDWNRVVLTCKDNRITVMMNGQQVIDMDVDKWTEANKNPDGSKNKFKTPIAKFKREGHIGLQDHGAKVMYRNVRVRPLNATPKKGDPACPKCGAEGKEGDYCAKCNAVITAYGEYKCNRCGKQVKSGTYCAKDNLFRFSVNNDEKCPKCGKTRGTWCEKCAKYACLPSVTYCVKCKKPFDRVKHDSKCPKCGTKVEPKGS